MAAEWLLLMDAFLASSLDPDTTKTTPRPQQQPRSLPTTAEAPPPVVWQQPPTAVRSSFILKKKTARFARRQVCRVGSASDEDGGAEEGRNEAASVDGRVDEGGESEDTTPEYRCDDVEYSILDCRQFRILFLDTQIESH
jgi:hypothetical protein